jgi:hypothetical protein
MEHNLVYVIKKIMTGLAIQEKSCLAPADCVRPEEDPKPKGLFGPAL